MLWGNFMSILYKLLSAVLLSFLMLWVPLLSAEPVNVNTATSTELQRIKGIGEKTAQRIIKERARGGHFESLDDLSIRIKGLGPKRAAKMVESGLVINNEQVEPRAKPSVVAKEVAAVKKRFNYP